MLREVQAESETAIESIFQIWSVEKERGFFGEKCVYENAPNSRAKRLTHVRGAYENAPLPPEDGTVRLDLENNPEF